MGYSTTYIKRGGSKGWIVYKDRKVLYEGASKEECLQWAKDRDHRSFSIENSIANSLHLQTTEDIKKLAKDIGVPEPHSVKLQHIHQMIQAGRTDQEIIAALKVGSAFQNGQSRAEREIGEKLANAGIQNAVRAGDLVVGKTVIWKGREFDVVKISGDQVTINDEGNRYTVSARELNPGTTGED